MSDSKKDLTRIEDLGEYLHQLDDDEDYLPDLPDESDPPQFIEETPISSDDASFSSDLEESNSTFESEVTDFSSDNDFSNDQNFQTDENENDFSSFNTFGSDESNFGSSDFESGSQFDSNDEFSSFDDFQSSDDFSSDSDFLSTNEQDDEPNEFNNSFEDSDLSNNLEQDSSEDKGLDSFTSESSDETSFSVSEDTIIPPIEEEPVLEKTPIPTSEPSTTYKEPENFEDIKKFAEKTSFSGMATEGNPSFSLLIKEIKYQEDAQDILILLKELELAMDSDDVLMKRLGRGEFIVPRISEFAATLLAHKLRRFDVDILVGLSDQIQPPKHTEEPEIGLVSKQSLYQNQSHHFQFGEYNLDISQIIVSATPTLDGYQVIKYIGVASEHKMLEGYLVEDENSLEITAHYNELAHKLKAHALKNQANAVVGLNYQLTPLPSHFGASNTRYRLTCTGNLVWINKI